MRPRKVRTWNTNLGNSCSRCTAEPRDSWHGRFRKLHAPVLDVALDMSAKQLMSQIVHVRKESNFENLEARFSHSLHLCVRGNNSRFVRRKSQLEVSETYKYFVELLQVSAPASGDQT